MVFLSVYQLDMFARQMLETLFCFTQSALFWRRRQTVNLNARIPSIIRSASNTAKGSIYISPGHRFGAYLGGARHSVRADDGRRTARPIRLSALGMSLIDTWAAGPGWYEDAPLGQTEFRPHEGFHIRRAAWATGVCRLFI